MHFPKPQSSVTGLGCAAAADFQEGSENRPPWRQLDQSAQRSAEKREWWCSIPFSTSLAGSDDNLVTAAIRGVFGERVEGYVDGQLAFYTTAKDDNAFAERVRIDEKGNVGIGTTKPKSMLAVAGGVTIGAGLTNQAAPSKSLAFRATYTHKKWRLRTTIHCRGSGRKSCGNNAIGLPKIRINKGCAGLHRKQISPGVS